MPVAGAAARSRGRRHRRGADAANFFARPRRSWRGMSWVDECLGAPSGARLPDC